MNLRLLSGFVCALLITGLSSCTENANQSTPLILPASLESRRPEFQGYVDAARENINVFARANGWEELAREAFMDSVMIFDDKALFNKTLLALAGADPATELPDTYCAALEKRVLIVMSPEFYARVYPEGVEEQSYAKLLTHEMAHRLHIRILNGNEDAMGPIWFYEGFAIYVANQFSGSKIVLSDEEMIRIMNEEERGSYSSYNVVFRRLAAKAPIRVLLEEAKNEDFEKKYLHRD